MQGRNLSRAVWVIAGLAAMCAVLFGWPWIQDVTEHPEHASGLVWVLAGTIELAVVPPLVAASTSTAFGLLSFVGIACWILQRRIGAVSVSLVVAGWVGIWRLNAGSVRSMLREARVPAFIGQCLVALASTAVAVFSRSVYFFFLAAACWLSCLFVTERALTARQPAANFKRALATKALELALIVTIVSGLCAAMSLYISRFLPDTITIGQLLRSERAIATLRDYSNALKLSSPATLILLSALLLAQMFIHNERHADNSPNIAVSTWKAVKISQKWIKRVSVGLLVATSFSFFGLHADGPAMRLEAHLKKAADDYLQLDTGLYNCLNLQLRSEIYARAWKDASPALRAGVLEEGRLARERAALRVEYGNLADSVPLRGNAATNLDRFRAEDARLQEALARASPPPDLHGSNNPADTLAEVPGANLGNIRRAAELAKEALRDIALRAPPEWLNGLGGDLAKTLMGLLISADHIPMVAPLVATIEARWPFAGEVIGSAEGALTDTEFERMKAVHQRLVREEASQAENRDSLEIAAAALASGAVLARPRETNDQAHMRAELDRLSRTVRNERRVLKAAIPPEHPSVTSLGVDASRALSMKREQTVIGGASKEWFPKETRPIEERAPGWRSESIGMGQRPERPPGRGADLTPRRPRTFGK
jgi:hypothetical protein